MFTPEGYWSFTEIQEAACSWANDLVIASAFPSLIAETEDLNAWKVEQVLHQKLVADEYVENAAEARFALQVSQLWVLANVLDTFDAVLCSPTGMTMRCPPPICAHGDALDWWTWPLAGPKFGTGEAYGYLEYFRQGTFSISDAMARFCVIDADSGLIKLKPNSIRLCNLSSYGHGADEKTIRTFINEQVRPIIGWSICWNPADIPKTKGEIYTSLGFTDINWGEFENGNVKSQSIADSGKYILECIETAFPKGKGDTTWPDVEAKVGYSRRSIIRALKQNGLHSKWAKTGQRQ